MKIKHQRGLWLRFDRILSRSLLKQLAVLGIVLVIAFGLSYLLLSFSGCDWEKFCEKRISHKWLLPLYLLIDTNALNNLYMNGVHGWMLVAGTLTFLVGAFIFNGVIIGIITNSIDQRVKNHQGGRIHYLKSGHYIIMGYDDIVPSIISYVFDKDQKAYVLILSSAQATDIKEKLSKSFDGKQMNRIIINYGHRVSIESYKDIYLEAAEQIFVVGNHSKPAHDAINIECVDCICRYLNNTNAKQRPGRITCVFNDLDTYSAFKTSEIFGEVSKLGIEFIPYNFYIGWAKQVFVKRLYKDFDNPGTEYHYPAVYGKGLTPDDDKKVHLVFIGTTNLAVAFATEAANVLHFPNYKKAKTLITFIDINADREKDEFITRNRHFFEVQPYIYRDLSDGERKEAEGYRYEYVRFSGEDAGFLDVEFEFIKGNVCSLKVQDEICRMAWEHNKTQYLSVFLALSDQRLNFAMGMNMPDAVYDSEVPIFIRQNRSDNFVTDLRNADRKNSKSALTYSVVHDGLLVQKKRNARYANIYPIGMNETAFSADEHSLRRAKLINYLYETADYSTYKFKGMLELSAIPASKVWAEADVYWRKLSVALKWSNLYNSYTIRVKQATLRAMRGLDIDDTSHDYDALSDYEVDEMARVEHNRWNVEKLLMGFRKPRSEEDKYLHPNYAGTLKGNKKLFIHHDIRPFEQLDIIGELDKEFSRYIPWIMKMTNDND